MFGAEKGRKRSAFSLVILTKDVNAWEKKGKEKEKYPQRTALEYGSYFFCGSAEK